MDDKFKSVYGSLYDTFQNQIAVPLQPQAAKVRTAIESAATELQITVREDAKYLLLVNFVEMVYRPLLDPAASPPAVSFSQLDEIVKDDIRTLIQESIANSQPPGTVSAHALLSSIGTIWHKIKTGATKLWEGS